MLRKFVIG